MSKKVIWTCIISTLVFVISVMAQPVADPVDIKIIVDENSLTVFVPGGERVSIQGIGFEVRTETGFEVTRLEDFTSLGGRFNEVTAPWCYRLIRENTNPVLPRDCTPDRTPEVILNQSNVFWYDNGTSNFITFSIVRDNVLIANCVARNTVCEVQYIPPPPTATPTITPDVVSTEVALETQAAGTSQAFTAEAIQTESAQTATQDTQNNLVTQTANAERQNAIDTQVAFSNLLTQQAEATNDILTLTATNIPPTLTATNTPPPTNTSAPATAPATNTPIPTPIPQTVQMPVIQQINDLAWSPNGQYFAGALRGGQVCIWEAITLIQECVPAHTANVYSVAWHPQELRLATTGADDEVRIWRLNDGRIAQENVSDLTASGVTKALEFVDVSWSPNGSRIASVDNQGRLFVWRTDSWERNPQINVQDSTGIDWYVDNSHIVSVATTGAIQILGVDTRIITLIGTHFGKASSVDWDSTSGSLVTTGEDGVLRLYNYIPGQECDDECDFLRLVQNQNNMTVTRVSPNGRLALVSRTGGVQIYETVPTNYLFISEFRTEQSTSIITAAAWSPDNTRIVAADDQNNLYVWQLSNETPQRLSEISRVPVSDTPLRSGVWDDQGHSVTLIDDNQTVHVWDVDNANFLSTFPSQINGSTVVERAENSAIIATGGCNGVVIWDISNLANVQQSRTLPHSNCISALAFNPSSDLLVTSDGSSTVGGIIHVWNWASALEVATTSLSLPITDIDWDTGGTRIAVSSQSGRFSILNMINNSAETLYTRQPSGTVPVNSIAWSPDSQSLVTGSEIGNVRVWDLQHPTKNGTFQGNYLLEGHDASILSVDWYSDTSQSYIVSISQDNTLIVWHGPTARRMARIKVPGALEVLWSPVELRFVTLNDDGTLSTWQFSP